MTKDYELLKTDIQALYPDQKLTDAELKEMTDRLIKVFAMAAEDIYEAKKATNQPKNANNCVLSE